MPTVYLSVSYSCGLAVAAASTSGPVGIDIEQPHRTIFDGFDEVALHPSERSRLTAMPLAARTGAKAKAWVGKEAFLKCAGRGLHYPPTSVELYWNGPIAHLLSWPPSVNNFVAYYPRLGIIALDCPNGVMGALAIASGDRDLQVLAI